MRNAKPSTTAVLPTPASPVRIGLDGASVRISTIWRISKSRPSTGSISPCLAGGQVDRVLIESWRLGSYRYPWLHGLRGLSPGSAALSSAEPYKIGQVFVQILRDLLQHVGNLPR